MNLKTIEAHNILQFTESQKYLIGAYQRYLNSLSQFLSRCWKMT